MEASNALVAIAYVNENLNNPYFVFCEYIKYCLSVGKNAEMTNFEIKESLKKECGLSIPQNVLIRCLRELKNNDEISSDKKGRLYKLKVDYNTDVFDSKRNEYKITEEKLVSALQEYVNQYGLTWDEEYSRKRLLEVLLFDHEATKIFLGEWHSANDQHSIGVPADEALSLDSNTVIDGEDSQPMIPDRIYTGYFIQHALEKDEELKKYLYHVAQGIMICIGAYQMADLTSESNVPQISETCFFLDTRLLLRYLGIGSKAAVQSIQELVQLIRDNKGKLYYYPHTLYEMQKALQCAIDQLYRGDRPRDNEMALFAMNCGNSPNALELKKAGLRDELEKKHIFYYETTDFADQDKIKFSFDQKDFSSFIANRTSWDSQTITNDAESIWYTHMMRSGNYQVYYGGRNRLCVFVSSNEKLLKLCRDYKYTRSEVKQISNWEKNRLPIITDIKLTCRLWSPSTCSTQLPLVQLSANAIAAQQPTRRYYEKLRSVYRDLHNVHPELAGISLPEYFDDRITESMLRKAKGNEEEINVENLASSIAELAQINEIEQQHKYEELVDQTNAEKEKLQKQIDAEHIKNTEAKRAYERQVDSIIDAAVSKNKNCIPLVWKVVLNAIRIWPVIVGVVFAPISFALGLNPKYIVIVIIAIIILKFIELGMSTSIVWKRLYEITKPHAVVAFKRQINKRLSGAEMPYEAVIIQRCVDENELLRKFDP